MDLSQLVMAARHYAANKEVIRGKNQPHPQQYGDPHGTPPRRRPMMGPPESPPVRKKPMMSHPEDNGHAYPPHERPSRDHREWDHYEKQDPYQRYEEDRRSSPPRGRYRENSPKRSMYHEPKPEWDDRRRSHDYDYEDRRREERYEPSPRHGDPSRHGEPPRRDQSRHGDPSRHGEIPRHGEPPQHMDTNLSRYRGMDYMEPNDPHAMGRGGPQRDQYGMPSDRAPPHGGRSDPQPVDDMNQPFDPRLGKGKCMLCNFSVPTMASWNLHIKSPIHIENVDGKLADMGHRQFMIRYGDQYMYPETAPRPKSPPRAPTSRAPAIKPLMGSGPPPPVIKREFRERGPPPPDKNSKRMCKFGNNCTRRHVPQHEAMFMHDDDPPKVKPLMKTPIKPVPKPTTAKSEPTPPAKLSPAGRSVCKFGLNCMNIKNENHRKAFIHGDGDGEADNAAKKEASQFKKPETKNTSASPKASALKKGKKPREERGAPSNVPSIAGLMKVGGSSELYDPFEVIEIDGDEPSGSKKGTSAAGKSPAAKKDSSEAKKSPVTAKDSKKDEGVDAVKSALQVLAKSGGQIEGLPKDMADMVKMLADRMRQEEIDGKKDSKGKPSKEADKATSGGTGKPGVASQNKPAADSRKDSRTDSKDKRPDKGRRPDERRGPEPKDSRNNKDEKSAPSRPVLGDKRTPPSRPESSRFGGSERREESRGGRQPSTRGGPSPRGRGSPPVRGGPPGFGGRGGGRGILSTPVRGSPVRGGPVRGGPNRGGPGVRGRGSLLPSPRGRPSGHGMHPMMGGPSGYNPGMMQYDTAGGYIEEAEDQGEFVGGYIEDSEAWIEANQSFEVMGKTPQDIEQAYREMSKAHAKARKSFETSVVEKPIGLPGVIRQRMEHKGPYGHQQPGSEGSMEMTMEEAAAVEQMQQLTGITDPSQLLMLVMSMNEVDPQVFMMLGDPQVQGILSSLQEILALLDTPSDQQPVLIQQLEQITSTEYFENPHFTTLLDAMGLMQRIHVWLRPSAPGREPAGPAPPGPFRGRGGRGGGRRPGPEYKMASF